MIIWMHAGQWEMKGSEVQNVQYISLKGRWLPFLQQSCPSLTPVLYMATWQHTSLAKWTLGHTLQMMKQQDRREPTSQMTTSSRTAMLTLDDLLRQAIVSLSIPEHPFGVCQQCKTWPLFSQPFSELSLQWACSRDKVISSLKQKQACSPSL